MKRKEKAAVSPRDSSRAALLEAMHRIMRERLQNGRASTLCVSAFKPSQSRLAIAGPAFTKIIRRFGLKWSDVHRKGATVLVPRARRNEQALRDALRAAELRWKDALSENALLYHRLIVAEERLSRDMSGLRGHARPWPQEGGDPLVRAQTLTNARRTGHMVHATMA
jgi:hypothetical protein